MPAVPLKRLTQRTSIQSAASGELAVVDKRAVTVEDGKGAPENVACHVDKRAPPHHDILMEEGGEQEGEGRSWKTQIRRRSACIVMIATPEPRLVKR